MKYSFVERLIKHIESSYTFSSIEKDKLNKIIDIIEDQQDKTFITQILEKSDKLTDDEKRTFNTTLSKYLPHYIRSEFTKLPLTFEEQLSLLESRHLSIPNRKESLQILQTTNYYHLRGYFIPFETVMELNQNNIFKPGTTFENIYNLYLLDQKLKTCLFVSIQKIELYIRTRLIYNISVDRSLYHKIKSNKNSINIIKFKPEEKAYLLTLCKDKLFYEYKQLLLSIINDKFQLSSMPVLDKFLSDDNVKQKLSFSHSYLEKDDLQNPDLYDLFLLNFRNSDTHSKNSKYLKEKLNENSELFINHYFLFYDKPSIYPPIWTAFETLTFVELIKWSKNLEENSCTIYPELNISSIVAINSSLSAIGVLRNIVAHHGRLVYRDIPLMNKLPKKLDKFYYYHKLNNGQKVQSKRLFNLILIIVYFMKNITKSDEWVLSLINILSNITPQQMSFIGCPDDWESKINGVLKCQ